jgi:ubiquinone/menaquinone biosynthesis C-methylase UbiE
MEKDYEKAYHESEYTYWWFVSRRDAIIHLLKDEDRSKKILDVGCAGGPLMGDLTERGFTNVYGIDYSAESIELCRQRGFKNAFVMDAHQPDFPDNSFDIIIASDSLEHLEKENTALSSWYRILKPGGKIYVFVPAFMHLWSEHDVVNMHYRRYTKSTLSAALRKAGFKIKKAGYWNFLMYFPTAVLRLLQRLTSAGNAKEAKRKTDIEKVPGMVNGILKFMIRKIENPVFRLQPFPVGVSVYAKAVK